MSVESELESLFVRISVDTSQIMPSAFVAEVEKIGKVIEKTLQPYLTIDFNFDVRGFQKNLTATRANFASFRLFVHGIVNEINSLIGGMSAKELDSFSTEAAAALSKIKRSISGTRITTAELTPLNQFLTHMKNFSQMTQDKMVQAAKSINEFRASVSAIGAHPGIDLFREQVVTLTTAIKALRVTTSGGIEINFLKGKANIEKIQELHKTLAALKLDKAVTLYGDVRQLQRDVLAAPLPIRTVTVRAKLDFVGGANQTIGPIPGLSSFTSQLSSAAAKLAGLPTPIPLRTVTRMIVDAYNLLSAVKGIPGLASFTGNIKTAVDALNKFGAMPQLKTLSINATGAAGAMARLNKELMLYSALMTGIGNKIPRVPTPSNPRGTSGVGVGMNRDNAFGFDPIRRFLAVGTSIATGAAVGFLGFDLFRQVGGFDQNMREAMSLRADMTDNVRATMEEEILNLSRRVATGPRELAEAYRELTAAGYGTAASIQALAVVEQFAFVGSMDAAKAARELAVLQRQLGLVSEDATQNANNLRYIADVITNVSLRSGMSVETFTNGLERLVPHVRFLNRGLEDSVALLASFGRIDASTAVSRSQALLRAITSQFIRSEEAGGAIRSGASPGRDPIGDHFRRFAPGQGVQPVHMMTESVRQAARAWQALGINPFDRGAFVGVADVIGQIDRVTRDMTAEGRENVLSQLFPGQLRSTATDAIRALLSSSDAMEQFYLAAQRSDGVLNQVANVRLQSFNSQLAILKNNIVVLAVELGKVLVPILRVINTLLVEWLDAWWELQQPTRMFIMSLIGIILALTSLRFLVPVVTGLFRTLFVDTIVAGVMAAWRTLVFLKDAFLFFGFVVQVVFVSAINMARASLLIFNAVAATTQFIMNLLTIGVWLVTGAFTVSTFAAAILKTSYIILNAVITALNFGLTAQWTLWVINKIALVLYIIALFTTTAATVVLKVATWLLNAALTVAVTLIAALLAVTGLLLVVMVALAAILVVIGLIIAGVIVIGLLAMFLIIVHVIEAMGGWEPAWRSFIDWVQRAFLATVGFFDNFRHNMNVLMQWMDQNWAFVMENVIGATGQAFENLFLNIRGGFARMLEAMANQGIQLLNNPFMQAAIRLAPGGAALLPLIPANAGAILPQAVMNEINRGRLDVFQGFRGRPIRPLGIEPQGAAAAIMGGIGNIQPGIRLGISDATREMIDNMFSRPRLPGEARDMADAANRIGDTFREISLNRFLLEGSEEDQDARRQELIEQQNQTDLLRRLVALAEENAAAAAWRIVP